MFAQATARADRPKITRELRKPSAGCWQRTANSWEPSQTAAACCKQRNNSRPDVIVIDLNLPNVHGLDACRLVKQVNPETKVIMFSAMNNPAVTQRAFEVGASAFVSKGTGDLLSTIKRLCDDQG